MTNKFYMASMFIVLALGVPINANAQIRIPSGFHLVKDEDEGKAFSRITDGNVTVWIFALGRELEDPEDDNPETMNKACIENIFGTSKYQQDNGIYHSTLPIFKSGYYNYYIFKPYLSYKIYISSKKVGASFDKTVTYIQRQVINAKDIYFIK